MDYALVPHKQMYFWNQFKVHLVTDIINGMHLDHPGQLPDHSLLTFNLVLPEVLQVDDNHKSEETCKWYNIKNIPGVFMNSEHIAGHIQHIEQKLNMVDTLDEAYTDFTNFIKLENGETS